MNQCLKEKGWKTILLYFFGYFLLLSFLSDFIYNVTGISRGWLTLARALVCTLPMVYWSASSFNAKGIQVGRVIGCGLLIYVGQIFLSIILVALFPSVFAGGSVTSTMFLGVPWWVYFVTTCVLGPIMEELVFRKYIYGKIVERMGERKLSIVICTLLFAVSHCIKGVCTGDVLEIFKVVNYLIPGFLLQMLYNKTNDLSTTILAHGLYNLCVII